MALRSLILTLSLLFGLQTLTAKADECLTVEKLAESIASEGTVLLGSRSHATPKLVAQFNKNRENSGNPERIEASLLVVGYVKEADGSISVGVAFVGADGCVINETATKLTPKMWIMFLVAAGVEPKDFVPITGA